jgi:hypothetical protein
MHDFLFEIRDRIQAHFLALCVALTTSQLICRAGLNFRNASRNPTEKEKLSLYHISQWIHEFLADPEGRRLRRNQSQGQEEIETKDYKRQVEQMETEGEETRSAGEEAAGGAEISEEGGKEGGEEHESEVPYNFPDLTKPANRVHYEKSIEELLADIEAEMKLLIAGYVPDPLACPFCDDVVSFPEGICPNNHKISTCSRTLLPVTSLGCRRCNFCHKLTLPHSYEEETEEFSWTDIKGIELYQCLWCGGNMEI